MGDSKFDVLKPWSLYEGPVTKAIDIEYLERARSAVIALRPNRSPSEQVPMTLHVGHMLEDAIPEARLRELNITVVITPEAREYEWFLVEDPI